MALDLLLIGSGITNAICAAYLRKAMPAANIVIWEKGRGIGGRMSKCISPADDTCSADLGAQYITTTTQTMSKYGDIYGALIRDDIIQNLTAKIRGMKKYEDNTKHFVAPRGMNSVVKYFLPEENIKFNSKALAIEEKNGRFTVTSDNGETFSADIVISTLPIPQFLQLQLSLKNLVRNQEELENVIYSSRFVLVLFYHKSTEFPDTGWACQYLDHQVFRYISIDNVKRNRPQDPVAVVFHTSVKFGLENLETTLEDMKEILFGFVKEMFPDWPEPSATRCHKWRYSQVVKPFRDKPGCLMINQNPLLILGGDAFSESNFDGCIYSALKIVEVVRQIWN